MNIVVESQSGYFTTAILKWNYFTGRFVGGSKPLRWLIMAVLLPMWYLGQKLAPFLDKFDHDWALETSGYFATRKNRES